MKAEALVSLVARLERAGVSEMLYRDGAEALTLRLAPAEPGAPVAAVTAAARRIRSNGTGTFSRSHPLADGVPSGTVGEGDLVGYLMVGSVLSAIAAPADGTAGSPLVEDGMTVGYGQAILEVFDA